MLHTSEGIHTTVNCDTLPCFALWASSSKQQYRNSSQCCIVCLKKLKGRSNHYNFLHALQLIRVTSNRIIATKYNFLHTDHNFTVDCTCMLMLKWDLQNCNGWITVVRCIELFFLPWSGVTIGFNPTTYTVIEDVGNTSVVVSLLSGILARDLIVSLLTLNGTAMGKSHNELS